MWSPGARHGGHSQAKEPTKTHCLGPAGLEGVKSGSGILKGHLFRNISWGVGGGGGHCLCAQVLL